jgi:Domain of unknown function (DUF5060)
MKLRASTSMILQLLLVSFVSTLLVDKVTSQEGRVGAVTGFHLVNAENGADIGLLANNQVLYLDTLPPEWTMVATTTSNSNEGGVVGSVAFNLDGDADFRTENVEPWTMTGDETGKYYHGWNPVPLGKHTVIATPFESTSRQGVAGTPVQVAFTVEETAPSSGGTSSSDVPPYNYSATGALSGELRAWHKITLGFVGPFASETDEYNPFTNYLLNVTFSHVVSGKSYIAPGYFAADGNAANSGASAGNVWMCHFAPDQAGTTWNWEASMFTGINASFMPSILFALFLILSVIRRNVWAPMILTLILLFFLFCLFFACAIYCYTTDHS